MRETLRRICDLQPQYASENTPAMKERGVLIRRELSNHLRERLSAFQTVMDSIFDDLEVDASDGIGRKTEAPWVRVYSKTMSPNPRDGYYLVIHFAANGEAVFVTVGCGSTIWRGGELKAVSDEELANRTSWAREVVRQKWGTLSPFTDVMDLGAKRPLPRTFEKATAFAKRINRSELQAADIDSILVAAMERLGEIYIAQVERRDMSPGEQASEEILEIVKPLRGSYRRQGRGLTAAERTAVELQAMKLAIEQLRFSGYVCEDTSRRESFDILARRGDLSLKVEVKGTTSDLCDSVVMTKNEVALHRSEKGRTALILVSKIKLNRGETEVSAEEGVVEIIIPWDIDSWSSEATVFQVSRYI
jgi:hypothetical protein